MRELFFCGFVKTFGPTELESSPENTVWNPISLSTSNYFLTLKDSQMIDLFGKTGQTLAAADKARDARQWPAAADHYRKYLTTRPEDAAIWVQFGHALKEAGAHTEAEGAYKRSLELAPNIADTNLQLGHLYKMMHRSSSAVSAYRKALRLDSTLGDARHELQDFGLSPDEAYSVQTNGLVRKPATFIDLSDVFFYLRHHKTLSGIQRVQLGIATAIIAMSDVERSGILFLSEADDQNGYIIIEDVFITEIAEELSRESVAHNHLLTIMQSATRRGQLWKSTAGDSLLILGAFWVLQNIAERIIALRRKGVRVGTLIHDIIPITHPEFCEKSLTHAFRAFLFSVLSVADFIFTVSDHSGRCVEEFLVTNKIPHAPIRTLRPAHKTWDASANTVPLSPAIARLLKEDYVLYVSTIEVRKNHSYLFRIWKRLIERVGKKTPTLVFIGRAGWRVNDLLEQLDSTSNLNGKIKILHDLTDVELAELYKSASFTVFPSFEEGWGLPVGESLIFGRPCIASSTSSIPEVGGAFVDYIDPFNDNDGYEKVLRFVTDKDSLDERARHIRQHFKPRGWSDVARDMIGLVQSSISSAEYISLTVEAPEAAPGHIYHFGHGDNVSNFIDSGDSGFVHLACDTNWGSVENFGRWLKGRVATLEFTVNQRVDEATVVMLELFSVGWLGSTQLKVTANDREYPLITPPRGARQYLLLEVIPERGRITIELAGLGEITEGPDERKSLWLGLGLVAHASPNDQSSRLALLEHLLFDSNGVIRLRPMLA